MLTVHELAGQIYPAEADDGSLLITCASYEERSTGVIRRLCAGYKTERSVVFRSGEYSDKGKAPEYFREIWDGACGVSINEPLLIEFCIDHSIPPMAQFEAHYRDWHTYSPIQQVTVDITTFPRQELFMLLRILDNLPERPIIRLFYSEPQKYGTEDEGGWLTRGVKSVRTVPGFGGVQPPRKKNLLIMFLGHEEERAAITWKRHQPSKTIAIVPTPSYRQELNGIVERTHKPLFMKVSDATFYEPSIPARGVEESQNAILEIWERYHESYFLVVAPLSTKLQALGIYKAAKQKRDIQITYAVPAVYNYNNFSLGIRRTWEVAWS